MPVRLTDCTAPEASLLLSAMFKVAGRLPVTVGSNATLMMQLPPAATELPHVLELG